MKDLKEKVAVITGAASGIGKSFAIALAKEGMHLCLSDIDMENLEIVKQEVEKLGVKVISLKCDVSKYEDFENLGKEVYSKLGGVDLLINNAGIAVGVPLEELELEDWKKTLDVNLWSIIHSIKVFVPKMMEKKSGHIVNVASGAGVLGTTEPLPYITSKFAVVGISEGLYSQLHGHGINVSVIIPVYINTNIFKRFEFKFSKKMRDNIEKEKLDEIRTAILENFAQKAMSPDRAVRKYMAGIKKNELYVTDTKGLLSIIATKGNDPQGYEKFLLNYAENGYKTSKELFSRFGINLDDYS